LPDSYRQYLVDLPLGPMDVTEGVQLVHGAVSHEDDYIFTEADADDNFSLTDKKLTFFGHSHFPCVFLVDPGGESKMGMGYECDEFIAVKVEPGKSMLVNPGSIGQPRDGDPRASFAIWDQDHARIEFYRVEYDIARTQEKMRAAQLPTYLIDRLSQGR
jgi:diadenosine tetraphosphatase ApaH/serine/threonine PP2A family protein phosphatase